MIPKIKYTDYIKNIFIKYSVVIIIIIFCLYLASLFIAYQFVVIEKNRQANLELNAIVNNDFDAYENQLIELAKSDIVKQAFKKNGSVAAANEALYIFRNDRTFKSNFVLLDQNGDIISTSLYKNNVKSLDRSILKHPIRKMIDGQPVHRRLDDTIFQNGQTSSYYFASPITDDNQAIQGYLFYFLEDFNDKLPFGSDIYLLTDSNENIISTSDDALISSIGKTTLKSHQNNSIAKVDGKSYFLTRQTLLNGHFHTYNLTSISTFQQMVLVGICSFIGIALIMTILIYFILPKIMKQSVQSFQKLLQYINQPDSNHIEPKFKEFQQVKKQFSKKLQEINKLNHINQTIEKTKNNMEIKQLEAQFNPHFAFNVLEMLRYQIEFEPEIADQIIVSFANLMRYNTYYGETTIALKTDLKYVEDYLKLQKMRFNKRMDYEIFMEEDLANVEVPKLIIQPLIENSIKHNMEQTVYLQINITIRHRNGQMLLSVTDNGVGITDKTLKEIIEMIKSGENIGHHYGLYHCQRIIQLLYGEEYGLEVNSKKGAGTTITVRMPIN